MGFEDDTVSDAPFVALLVDDDESMRRLCRALLEREGWNVLEAGDGIEGLRTALSESPDVIVMDVVMPTMDGLETTRSLRADPLTQNIPVIIVSAECDAESVAAGIEAGADEYLSKSAFPAELAARSRSMARLSRVSSQLRRSNEVLGHQTYALTLLLDFTAALARTEDLDKIMDHTIGAAATLTAARRVSIMLPEPGRRVLRVRRSVGMDAAAAARIVVPVGGAISGEVFAANRQIVLNTREEVCSYREMRYDWEFFESAPLVSTPMCASENVVGVLNVADRIENQPLVDHELEYLRLISHHAASAIQLILTREARDAARDSIVVALAKLAEHRDDDTGKHLERMTLFCLELARELRDDPEYARQIDAEFLRNLKRAAPLHDIGKVAIPDAILLKPGKLTDDEMKIMRTHVTVGAETLRSVLTRCQDSAFLKMAEDIAYGHHEWYDGGGYPQGLKGKEIPLVARIAALADVYDALTTKRVYKDAIPHAQAVSIIAGLAGRQFDPKILQAFLRRESQFEKLAADLADASPKRPPAGSYAAASPSATDLIAPRA